MTTPPMPERSYGCSFACGNPYDVIVVTVLDGSTQFLCLPCFIRLARDMLEAMTDPDSTAAQNAALAAASIASDQAPGPKGKPRGHNAPAENTDPDVWSAFDGVTTYEEMPADFRADT